MTRWRTRACAMAGLLAALAGCADSRSPIERAVQWLAAQQRDDGMLVSPRYGVLSRGESTTAAAALALALLPDTGEVAAMRDRALAALLRRDAPTPPAPPEPVDYPCYTAASLLHALALADAPHHRAAIERLVAWLRTRQFAAATGCPENAPEFGGFGLGDVVREHPAGTELVGLSVTTAVLEALAAAGVPHDDPMVRAARSFVERCQWFGDAVGPADGGFCFAPTGDWRAGKAGMRRNADGDQRAVSYGTATVDGIRALLACGVPAEDPRVRAALAWLAGRNVAQVPGIIEHDPQFERSLRLYWLRGLVALARQLPDHAEAPRWRNAVREQLTGMQSDGGHFAGLGDAMKEDDPLVATALSLAALACMREDEPRSRDH